MKGVVLWLSYKTIISYRNYHFIQIYTEKYLSSLLEFYKNLPLAQFDQLHKFVRNFSAFGGESNIQNEIYQKYLQIQINWRAFVVAADNSSNKLDPQV